MAFETYQTLRMWSVMHDCDTVRVSMWDDHGREYFVMIVDNEGYKQLRANRENAIDSILDAHAAGADPGEVVLVHYDRTA